MFRVDIHKLVVLGVALIAMTAIFEFYRQGLIGETEFYVRMILSVVVFVAYHVLSHSKFFGRDEI